MSAKRAEATGLLIGALAAAVCLVAASVWLLQVEATSAKVLVAVWLWALPALGVGALAGYAVAKAAVTFGGRR